MKPKYDTITKLDVIKDLILEVEAMIPSQAGGHYYTTLNVLSELEDKTRTELREKYNLPQDKAPEQKTLFN